jgi:hypothetical protein
MGQHGSLTFYKTRRLDAPPAVLRKLIQLAAPEHVLELFRSVGEDNGWEVFQRGGPGVRDEMLQRPQSLEELVSQYRDGTRLSVDAVGSPLARRVQDAIASQIPPSIRGDFVPTDQLIRIGYHDIWDDAEHEEGCLIARAFLSIDFFGYSTPNDWLSFREQVLRISEVHAVKRELEAITGPLDQCIIWNI